MTDPDGAPGGSRDEQTARIADLAEEIVDRVSEAGQDWCAIELRVRDLLELVRRQKSGR